MLYGPTRRRDRGPLSLCAGGTEHHKPVVDWWAHRWQRRSCEGYTRSGFGGSTKVGRALGAYHRCLVQGTGFEPVHSRKQVTSEGCAPST